MAAFHAFIDDYDEGRDYEYFDDPQVNAPNLYAEDQQDQQDRQDFDEVIPAVDEVERQVGFILDSHFSVPEKCKRLTDLLKDIKELKAQFFEESPIFQLTTIQGRIERNIAFLKAQPVKAKPAKSSGPKKGKKSTRKHK